VNPSASSTVGANVSGGATSGNIGLDTNAPGSDVASSAQGEASRAQNVTSAGSQAESTVTATTDPATSARGRVDGAVNVDASAGVQGNATSRVDELRNAGSRRPDAEGEVRTHFSAQDQAVGDAQAKRDEAERIGSNPRGAATARAEGEAVAGVNEVSPVDTGTASAQVGVATSTVNDPRGAAQSRVDSAVAEKKSEARADVGIQADVNVSATTPDPTKK
jgi:hypothetical protein